METTATEILGTTWKSGLLYRSINQTWLVPQDVYPRKAQWAHHQYSEPPRLKKTLWIICRSRHQNFEWIGHHPTKPPAPVSLHKIDQPQSGGPVATNCNLWEAITPPQPIVTPTIQPRLLFPATYVRVIPCTTLSPPTRVVTTLHGPATIPPENGPTGPALTIQLEEETDTWPPPRQYPTCNRTSLPNFKCLVVNDLNNYELIFCQPNLPDPGPIPPTYATSRPETWPPPHFTHTDMVW